MVRRSPRIGWIITLVAPFLLTACFSTELTPLEPPSGLEKLVNLSDSNIPVQIQTAGFHDHFVGHQYLFFAIPMTRIYLPNLEADTRMQLSVACGMRGYRCTESATQGSKRVLEITIRDARVNGYDLLVVRKPAASVTMFAQLFENGEVIRSCEENYTATNTTHYAFTSELQSALSEALLQGSYKLLDCLGMNRA
jgi:hypothetical protein